jgi:hypothetical protein
MPSAGGIQETNIIPEGDIYRLIIKAADQSRNPEIKAKAERFERWIFDEVLPSIRKDGAYMPKPMTPAEILAATAQQLVEMEKKVERLDTKLTKAVDIFAVPVGDDWRHEINEKINGICVKRGFNHQVFRHELYRELESVARVDLGSRQARFKARLRQAGSTAAELRAATKLDMIERDPKLRQIFESIVRRHQAVCITNLQAEGRE